MEQALELADDPALMPESELRRSLCKMAPLFLPWSIRRSYDDQERSASITLVLSSSLSSKLEMIR